MTPPRVAVLQIVLILFFSDEIHVAARDNYRSTSMLRRVQRHWRSYDYLAEYELTDDLKISNYRRLGSSHSLNPALPTTKDEITIPSTEQNTIDYIVEVKTSSIFFAGTDANIYITIHGDEGMTNETLIPGSFERYDLDNITLTDLIDVGILESVTVRNDGSGFAPDWYLSWISVNNEKAIFNQWIDADESVSAFFSETTVPVTRTSSFPSLASTSVPSITPMSLSVENTFSLMDYVVKIKTGDIAFAGTGSNIYIIIHGDEGITSETLLNSFTDVDAFERDELATTTLKGLRDVGELESITIRSDGTGFSPDWYLSWISVNDERIIFNRWINSESVSEPFTMEGTTSENEAISSLAPNKASYTIIYIIAVSCISYLI